MYPTNCNVGGASFNPYYPTGMIQPQQSMPYTRPSIIGKVVNKVEDVTPNDIPMDGSYGVFPLENHAMIFMKKWNSDGTITTEIYERKDIPKEPVKDPIAEEMQALREQLDRIEKALKAKPTKKEVANNE